MCVDPVSAIAIAGVVTAAAGQATSALSGAAQSRYEARIADRNAALDREGARDALERGRKEEQRYERELGQRMGSQRAAMAANGIDLSFGSAADFLADTGRIGQEDAATIRENSMREARGMEISAANFGAQASGLRSKAKGQLVAGAFEVGSTLLGGAQQYRRGRASRSGAI